MVTRDDTPGFRFEYEHIGGRGELIVIVGTNGTAMPLSGYQTRLLHILLEAWDKDPVVPASIRGLRTYAEIAKAYAKHAGYCVAPQPGAMGRYMYRIQRRFNATWAETFPDQEPPRLFDRRGARGARLALEIPRERRGRRGLSPDPSPFRSTHAK